MEIETLKIFVFGPNNYLSFSKADGDKFGVDWTEHIPTAWWINPSDNLRHEYVNTPFSYTFKSGGIE
jgi:hypothetical protein